MTSSKRDDVARKRGELSRDGVGRRLSPAIDARRRLNAQRASATGTSARRFGPSDRRHDYLMDSHD
jgi:hypothetical protein